MWRREAAILFVGLILASAAWCRENTAQAEPMTVTLTEGQNGSTVALALESTLTVRLSAQLGTGYSWAITQQNGQALRLTKEYVESPSGLMPGGTETQVFVFSSIAAGDENVELAYRQPWQSDQPPARTFRFRAIVQESGK